MPAVNPVCIMCTSLVNLMRVVFWFEKGSCNVQGTANTGGLLYPCAGTTERLKSPVDKL